MSLACSAATLDSKEFTFSQCLTFWISGTHSRGCCNFVHTVPVHLPVSWPVTSRNWRKNPTVSNCEVTSTDIWNNFVVWWFQSEYGFHCDQCEAFCTNLTKNRSTWLSSVLVNPGRGTPRCNATKGGKQDVHLQVCHVLGPTATLQETKESQQKWQDERKSRNWEQVGNALVKGRWLKVYWKMLLVTRILFQ